MTAGSAKAYGRVPVESGLMRLLRSLAVFVCVLVLGSGPAVAAHCFPSNPKETSAFEQGIVDGHWVGVVLDYSGGNGGAFDAIVYTMRVGGNGLLLHSAGKIKAIGDSADRLGVLFANNKLYVLNAIYLPGEAHCCYTHDAVQRFGFEGDDLVAQGQGTIDISRLPVPKLTTSNGHSCVDDAQYLTALRRAVVRVPLSP